MKLHKIKHDLKSTLWCGPAALSAVTGEPTSRIHGIIKGLRGNDKPIIGVRNSELVKAARILGFELEPIFDAFAEWRAMPACGLPLIYPTLAKFVRVNRDALKDPVIINVTGHYVTVHRRTFVDNNVNPEGVRLKTAPHRRCRVKRAWRVVPKLTLTEPSC
jgi:hypothetical protein